MLFELPAEFRILDVEGIMMKRDEHTVGTRLSGITAKGTAGHFFYPLTVSDLQSNLPLIKERSWFDLALLYNNQRRAIIAFEKGGSGLSAFAEAFAAWGEPPEGARGYLVQITSQRSEADARLSSRTLQEKFPTLLGNQQVIIRRADLGAESGVFYRGNVGPFRSAEDAFELCGKLKAAGAQCVVSVY